MSDGTIITVTTSLSQAEGDDSVLINKMEYADSISLPMSYARTEDVFYFKFEKSNGKPSRPQETTKSARQVTDPPGAIASDMKFIYMV